MLTDNADDDAAVVGDGDSDVGTLVDDADDVVTLVDGGDAVGGKKRAGLGEGGVPGSGRGREDVIAWLTGQSRHADLQKAALLDPDSRFPAAVAANPVIIPALADLTAGLGTPEHRQRLQNARNSYRPTPTAAWRAADGGQIPTVGREPVQPAVLPPVVSGGVLPSASVGEEGEGPHVLGGLHAGGTVHAETVALAADAELYSAAGRALSTADDDDASMADDTDDITLVDIGQTVGSNESGGGKTAKSGLGHTLEDIRARRTGVGHHTDSQKPALLDPDSGFPAIITANQAHPMQPDTSEPAGNASRAAADAENSSGPRSQHTTPHPSGQTVAGVSDALVGSADGAAVRGLVRPANGWSAQSLSTLLAGVETKPVSVQAQRSRKPFTPEAGAALAGFVWGYAKELRLWHAYGDGAALPQVIATADHRAVADIVSAEVRNRLRSVLGPFITQQLAPDSLVGVELVPSPQQPTLSLHRPGRMERVARTVGLRVDRPEIDYSPHPISHLTDVTTTALRDGSGIVQGLDFTSPRPGSARRFAGAFTRYWHVKGGEVAMHKPVPWDLSGGSPYFVRAELEASGPGFVRVTTATGEHRLGYEEFGHLLAQDGELRRHPAVVLVIPGAAARNLDLARAIADRVKLPVWSHTGTPVLRGYPTVLNLEVVHPADEPAGQWHRTPPQPDGTIRERTATEFFFTDGRLFLESDLRLIPLATDDGQTIGHRSHAPTDSGFHRYWPLRSLNSYRMGQYVPDRLVPEGPDWNVPWKVSDTYFFDAHGARPDANGEGAGSPLVHTMDGKLPMDGARLGAVIRRRRSFTELLASQAFCLVCRVGQGGHLAGISRSLGVETFGATSIVSVGGRGFTLEAGGVWVRARDGAAHPVPEREFEPMPSGRESTSAGASHGRAAEGGQLVL
ncbi:hypothetical protein [Actinacidiphila glaucinigra]|uniref:hypothetical protein n=1 Tax=Actinacidiphila glaucinigra TaxID=235986 RepID=UPI0035E2FA9C